MKTYQLFIDGQWVDAKSGETFDDFNPFTGELYAKAAKGGVEDADSAMAAAYAARKGWAATPAIDRAKILNKAAQLLEAKTQEFADVLIHEGGGSVGEVFGKVDPLIRKV